MLGVGIHEAERTPLFFNAEKGRRIIGKRNRHIINEDIRFSKVRVVDANGEMIGIIPIEDALDKARQVGLDLVSYHRIHKILWRKLWITVNMPTIRQSEKEKPGGIKKLPPSKKYSSN